LPNFRLIELQRISEAFNTLAANLEWTTRETTQLAAKLVDHQEQERLDLARDLHDEFAQSLSAMSAVAASIKATAETECPALVPEADNLSQISMAMMRSLRTTLRALRPPEIDDFGLAASLSALVRDQERLAGGQLKILLEINGDLRRCRRKRRLTSIESSRRALPTSTNMRMQVRPAWFWASIRRLGSRLRLSNGGWR
jgi:signal transduction histidine kinase